MNIGVNATRFTVAEPGGAVQVGIHTTNELLERQDVTVTVFGPKSALSPLETTEIIDSWNLSQSRPYSMAWERTVLPYIADQHGIDVLYTPHSNGPLFDTPYGNVICIHDMNDQRGFSNSFYQTYKRIVLPRTVDVADAIVTVSNFSKREICDLYEVPESKVHVVYNGIDPLFVDDSPGSQWDLPNEYILYIGAMNPRKNIQGVISAFCQLKSQSDLPHKLVLIGPKNKAVFKDLYVESTEDVILPGFVTKQELKFAYNAADVFVFPSFYEGFGIPPLEAMACGTPVIASNTSSFPEVLGDAALLVDPYDVNEIAKELHNVLSSSSLHNKLISKGKRQVKKYTWKSSVESLLEVFKKVD